MSNMPYISHNHRVCVICEGLEEEMYFRRLLSLNIWSSTYEFYVINAKGESNIFARFQDAYNNDRYEMIIIFCDTDKSPYREYSLLKKKLNEYFGKRTVARKIILWANPCSMQIILSHFGDVRLANQGKKTNANIIRQLTGIDNYKAHEKQINELCNKIYRRTYPDMKRRSREDEYEDTNAGSSNAVHFFELFEADDTRWINEINKYLEG